MNPASYSLRQMVMYFLKLGTTGFGGPVALAGYMHRDLVEKRNWLLWIFYFTAIVVTVITQSEELLLFIAAGLIYMLVKAPAINRLAVAAPKNLAYSATLFIYQTKN